MKSYLFTKNNIASHSTGLPVLVSDYSVQGSTYSPHAPLPDTGMTARSFVIAHLNGEAEKKGLPRLSVDESISEALFTVAFRWLTNGVPPDVMEIASLIRLLEKQGKEIPPINFGRSGQQRRVALGTLQ